MLHDAVEDPAALTPAELREAYEIELRAAVEAAGIEAAAAAADVDEGTVRALLDGKASDLTLERAAALLAIREDAPDAEAVAAEVRDHLLMGMVTGVVDVDTVAANVDLDLSGTEIRQGLEGRMPLTLAQLAAIHRYVAGRNDR
ncbi:MAG: DUF5791 family protein [Haloferacaceae archaeon]